MHPSLDRPHPDCEDVVRDLKACHDVSFWNRISGACNDYKLAVDKCFKAEKHRLLSELNKDLPERQKKQEDIMKLVFGQNETFSEYLQRDPEYIAARSAKQEK